MLPKAGDGGVSYIVELLLSDSFLLVVIAPEIVPK
jgi:hypothetical protein